MAKNKLLVNTDDCSGDKKAELIKELKKGEESYFNGNFKRHDFLKHLHKNI